MFQIEQSNFFDDEEYIIFHASAIVGPFWWTDGSKVRQGECPLSICLLFTGNEFHACTIVWGDVCSTVSSSVIPLIWCTYCFFFLFPSVYFVKGGGRGLRLWLTVASICTFIYLLFLCPFVNVCQNFLPFPISNQRTHHSIGRYSSNIFSARLVATPKYFQRSSGHDAKIDYNYLVACAKMLTVGVFSAASGPVSSPQQFQQRTVVEVSRVLTQHWRWYYRLSPHHHSRSVWWLSSRPPTLPRQARPLAQVVRFPYTVQISRVPILLSSVDARCSSPVQRFAVGVNCLAVTFSLLQLWTDDDHDDRVECTCDGDKKALLQKNLTILYFNFLQISIDFGLLL